MLILAYFIRTTCGLDSSEYITGGVLVLGLNDPPAAGVRLLRAGQVTLLEQRHAQV